jgi:predicted PurR-regulated permease PerM
MIAERILMGMLLGGVAVGCTVVLYPFFSTLLWAAILAYTTWPMFEWLRLRMGRMAAAAVMVALTAVLVVLPLALAAPSGADDAHRLVRAFLEALQVGLPSAPKWLYGLPAIGPTLGDLWNSWAADLSVMVAAFRPYFGQAAQFGLDVLLGIAHGVLLFLMALFVAFFFYAYGERIAKTVHLLMHRIAGSRAPRLIEVTGATIRGVVYGILGTALMQVFLTTMGLWLAGVPRPSLFGVIAGTLSVLPIGAPLVWIPAGIWLLASGHLVRGIGLLVYGSIVISGADTIIRPYFISRGAELPFLLTLLGVLGGALAFGLLGVFVGPVLLGVGFALIKEWASSAVVPGKPGGAG